MMFTATVYVPQRLVTRSGHAPGSRRVVPTIGFLSVGANSAHPSRRDLPYTDRISSWKFLFSPLHRKLPLRPLKKTKHTEFTLKGDLFSQLVNFL